MPTKMIDFTVICKHVMKEASNTQCYRVCLG